MELTENAAPRGPRRPGRSFAATLASPPRVRHLRLTSRDATLFLAPAVGTLGAAWVGYLAAENPRESPGHEWEVILRVAIVLALIATGVFAQTSKLQERMGRLLVLAGFFSVPWLLQGSSDRLPFSVGVLCTGLAPLVFGYLLLAHPDGRLRSGTEQRFSVGVAVLIGAGWAFVTLTTVTPPLATPLIACAPHCPRNALFLGFTTGATPALKSILALAWVTWACGLVSLLGRRARSVSPPVRRAITPVLAAAALYAVSVIGFLLSHAGGSHAAVTFGAISAACYLLVPLAILLGLIRERLFMARALETLINRLAGTTSVDLEAAVSEAVHDPSLRIAYHRPAIGSYVDSSGVPIATPAPDPGRAVTRIERDGSPVAIIIHDPELCDQRRFITAVGGAALLCFENSRLEADLRSSMTDLASSRMRLVHTADAERRRIERNLHDGAQQHLVGMRLRLELAIEAIKHDPDRGEQLLAAIGRQMDDALDELRSLARGVYPPLLPAHGVGDALASAARLSPMSTSVDFDGIGRYPPETEVAVYFCCLEALQNAAKHAGSNGGAAVHLWEDGRRLCFEVSDHGVGFVPGAVPPGSGLVNMTDRIDAVGGTLSVSSSSGHGTVVSGSVPLGPPV